MSGVMPRSTLGRVIVLGVLLGAISFGLFGFVQRVTASSNPLPVALQRAATPADALPSSVASVLSTQGYDTSSSRQIGTNIYVVPRAGNLLCIVSIRGSAIGSGCNSSSDFFGGDQLVFGVGSAAGAAEHIAGVAQTGVADVRLTANGSTTTVATSSDGGFSFDVPSSSAASAGVSAGTLDALDASGKVLQSFPLPSN
jgi:hypothetical protein